MPPSHHRLIHNYIFVARKVDQTLEVKNPILKTNLIKKENQL